MATMEALVGRVGHVTLEKPIRVNAPGSDRTSSVRVVAFDGEIVEVGPEFVTVRANGLVLHPDDTGERASGGRLAMYAPDDDEEPIHVRTDLIQAIAEVELATPAERTGPTSADDRRRELARFLLAWGRRLGDEALTLETTPPLVTRFGVELHELMGRFTKADLAEGVAARLRR